MRELQKEVRDLHSTMISSIRHVMSRLQSLEYSPHSTRYAVLRFGPLRHPPVTCGLHDAQSLAECVACRFQFCVASNSAFGRIKQARG